MAVYLSELAVVYLSELASRASRLREIKARPAGCATGVNEGHATSGTALAKKSRPSS